jgi:hypothetical protein
MTCFVGDQRDLSEKPVQSASAHLEGSRFGNRMKLVGGKFDRTLRECLTVGWTGFRMLLEA